MRKDSIIFISTLMPAVTKRRKAKIRDTMSETLIFLYCLAFIDFNITSLRVDNLLLAQKSNRSTQLYILDCKMTSSIIPPKIKKTNIELKRSVCVSPSF